MKPDRFIYSALFNTLGRGGRGEAVAKLEETMQREGARMDRETFLAALDDERLAALRQETESLGMEVLWEVHDLDEMQRVGQFEPKLVGVNNRDLKTFNVRLETTRDLVPHTPDGALLVSESGFFERHELEMMSEWGAGAFLIGESLMRADDPGEALADLVRGS